MPYLFFCDPISVRVKVHRSIPLRILPELIVLARKNRVEYDSDESCDCESRKFREAEVNAAAFYTVVDADAENEDYGRDDDVA